MIISRTPFRISFFGGGTDYPEWYTNHGGAVLSTTFDKYCYVTCRILPPFFDHKYRIAYSKIENVKRLEEIEHPAIRAVINEICPFLGLEIHADADLPARSGLGSSSSFVVGLLHSLQALNGKRSTKQFLSNEAIRVERDILKESVGCQDQVAAANGGFNIIRFKNDKNIIVDPIIIDPKRLEDLNNHLLLFFTGFSRFASDIAATKINNISENVEKLKQIRSMVDEAYDILTLNRDLREFGDLLDLGWKQKRNLSDKVSTPQIDHIYDTAKKAGALGGKLLGAGGGGFVIFFAEEKYHHSIISSLSNLIHVPFRFENTGSQIVYYQP